MLKSIYKKLIPIRWRNALRHKLLSLRRFSYRGDAVVCVCCGGRFSQFSPFGAVNPRKNAACPNCDSMERHRFLFYFLENHTDFFTKKMRVLHFAPEIVLEPLFRKLKNWEYTTADIMEGLADKAFDMQNIPFEDNYFDFVIASHVTSYTEDEPLALRELARILKPETGVLLQLTRIHLPTEKSFTGGILDTQEREKTYGFDPFVKWVHGRDYVAILEKNNLKVKSIHYSDLVDIDFAEKNGFINSENEIFDGETIYFCTKNCE